MKDFKDLIKEELVSLLETSSINFSISDYDASDEEEEMYLTDINWEGASITIASDFILTALGNDKFEFESWRYDNFELLKDEFKRTIKEYISAE